MTRSRRSRSLVGFTLVQLVGVTSVVGLLIGISVNLYRPWALEARKRTCLTNQVVIGNAMAIWELQNEPLTTGPCRMTFDTGGLVASLECGDLGPRAKGPDAVTVGSRIIEQIVRDDRTFSCPERAYRTGQAGREREEPFVPTEVHYELRKAAGAVSGSGSAACLLYPRGRPDDGEVPAHER